MPPGGARGLRAPPPPRLWPPLPPRARGTNRGERPGPGPSARSCSLRRGFGRPGPCPARGAGRQRGVTGRCPEGAPGLVGRFRFVGELPFRGASPLPWASSGSFGVSPFPRGVLVPWGRPVSVGELPHVCPSPSLHWRLVTDGPRKCLRTTRQHKEPWKTGFWEQVVQGCTQTGLLNGSCWISCV